MSAVSVLIKQVERLSPCERSRLMKVLEQSREKPRVRSGRRKGAEGNGTYDRFHAPAKSAHDDRQKRRRAGSARGQIVIRDDFDDPLPGFEDYRG